MTKRQDAASEDPIDLRALFDMNGASLEYAERTYRAWLEGAGRIQNETLGFLNGRWEKGLETARELTQCKTPTEYFEAQARYADRAISDWVEQSQKMVRMLGELTIHSPDAEAEAAPRSRKTAH
jgi:hypothetical protein